MLKTKVWVAYGLKYIGFGSYVPVLLGVFYNEETMNEYIKKDPNVDYYTDEVDIIA